ncbi:PhnD/SsuA/transferrin family substrate-binding protein [Shewanella amazonensis]|uniref:histidine kinase n=2 Tax=Shewanella amazonensis TaxID=60478 RepID=A1S898_SHEAM|nr:sensor histidine kinase [Shewanella amazonensis SB2B]
MSKAWRLLLMLALLPVAMAFAGGAADEHVQGKQEVRIGILTFAERSDTLNTWQATADYLARQTGHAIRIEPLTPSELDRQVKARALDFIISNQFVAVGYKKDWGASQLLTLIPADGRDPARAMGSALVVRAGVSVTRWQQLTDLKIVSTDPRAFGGFLIFAGEMVRRGLDPVRDLPGLSFAGFPQTKLLQKLWLNEADMAILPACVLEQAIARGEYPQGAFDIALAKATSGFACGVSSELYPYTTLSKLGHTQSALATEVARALLSMEANTAAAISGGYRGWSVPVNDNRVFALKHTLREWPFQTNWQRVASAAMPWFGAIVLCLLLGYLHHLRIKRLVVKRTRALETEIEQHRETQRAFNEQQRQFYRAQRVLLTGEMASGISHELKQPLAGIRYLAQGCLYRLKDNEPEIASALGGVLTQVDRAQETISRLRSFCQQPSRSVPYRVDTLIEETLALISPELKRLKLEPSLALTEVEARLDPGLMTQVLVNVLLNALDAMAGQPTPWLGIALEAKDSDYLIRVSDNGCGLTEAQLSRLFFPFESAKADGLGLGMVICKRIVEEHGGKISAQNRFHHSAIEGQIYAPIHSSPCGLEICIEMPRGAAHD